jgi:hydrogenase nickel incorporation protein HypB
MGGSTMCGICGCDHGEARISTHRHDHAGDLHQGPRKNEAGPFICKPEVQHDVAGHAHHETGDHFNREHLLRIEQGILSKNNGFAAENRTRLAKSGVLALNLVSSPGAGKTSLLVATIERLRGRASIAVIEGDQETENDAERIRATGVLAIQINTGRGCHLDAHMLGHAIDDLPIEMGSILFIENVGNLVCPAAFDLGETHKVAILSVAEGEDKPLKYPDIFAAARLMIISKTDLLPYVRFDTQKAIEYACRVNPKIEILQLSTELGEGMDAWLDWVTRESGALLTAHLESLERERELVRGCLAAVVQRQQAGG